MSQRLHNDLKFELNQKEVNISDTIDAENEELHEKIIRERITTYEGNAFGSVHIDVCFVRNLEMRDTICQRNYKVTLEVVQTNVFPQVISLQNPRIKCLEHNKSCQKFCIKSQDLKKIPMSIMFDIM